MRTLILLSVVLLAGAVDAPINFSLQIRPILSEKCFHCHGPDEAHREAKLRLDIESAAKEIRDGHAAIVPGKPQNSLVWQRIATSDNDDIMPPLKAHRPMSDSEKSLIKQWIQQGAVWGQHWAFEPLTVAASLPSGSAAIDVLVAEQQQARGLSFAPPATPQVLARRLAFDLVGLPPTPVRADDFARAYAQQPDKAVAAYVDELLAAPTFGEHWARMWLDLARYADTRGYEKDNARQMWLYREWVINALNADMPFDQFTIEQLAGDLLPKPTQEQLIATAFHRNTMTNDEGGTDNEEFRTVAVKDRVDTTGQVWLGLTVGCAKCHSHKYDPITQADYYRLYAIFNQTVDADLWDDAPLLSLPTPEQSAVTNELAEKVKAAKKILDDLRKDDSKASRKDDETPEDTPAIAEAKKKLKDIKGQVTKMSGEVKSVLIMRELSADKKRETVIHERGNFLSKGAKVEPAVLPLPGLPSLPMETKANRLETARWLVAVDNPLTPRVTANRIWARLFGVGLVDTEEDFGSLGSLPSHPALLDFLAVTYRDTSRWSLKQLLRTMVLSRTYQQACVFDAQRQLRDPNNRWLSRGARQRLTAEQLRDQALFVSGLLSAKMGGRSVMPQQPDGLWRSTYNESTWKTPANEDQYRRGLYTFWKRTTPYPSMETFDAGSREVCQIRRIHTNTPLQALVTLNDPVYLEAAAHLAQQMCAASADPRQRAEFGLRRVLIRPVSSSEIDVVMSAYNAAFTSFATTPANGSALLAAAHLPTANGQTTNSQTTSELAAWTVAANVLLNLDEMLSRN